MPTYVYEIIETGETFEVVQGIKEEPFDEIQLKGTDKKYKIRRIRRAISGLESSSDKLKKDKEFTDWIDNGGLDNIPPTIKIPNE